MFWGVWHVIERLVSIFAFHTRTPTCCDNDSHINPWQGTQSLYLVNHVVPKINASAWPYYLLTPLSWKIETADCLMSLVLKPALISISLTLKIRGENSLWWHFMFPFSTFVSCFAHSCHNPLCQLLPCPIWSNSIQLGLPRTKHLCCRAKLGAAGQDSKGCQARWLQGSWLVEALISPLLGTLSSAPVLIPVPIPMLITSRLSASGWE